MTPTNEQIIAEAERRWKLANSKSTDYPLFIIEVMREGWTPPEPVDPDILAFREWLMECRPVCKTTAAEGDWDRSVEAQAYLAGARMAREQERERAEVPIRMAEQLADRCRRLLHSLPAGVHDQLDVKWGIDAFSRAIEAEIAKYEESGR